MTDSVMAQTRAILDRALLSDRGIELDFIVGETDGIEFDIQAKAEAERWKSRVNACKSDTRKAFARQGLIDADDPRTQYDALATSIRPLPNGAGYTLRIYRPNLSGVRIREIQ